MQILLLLHCPLFPHGGLHVFLPKMRKQTWYGLHIPNTQMRQSLRHLGKKNQRSAYVKIQIVWNTHSVTSYSYRGSIKNGTNVSRLIRSKCSTITSISTDRGRWMFTKALSQKRYNLCLFFKDYRNTVITIYLHSYLNFC